MSTYNRRFAKEPKNPIDAHRDLDSSCDLERILSIQETRKASKTLSFQYESTHFQILEEGWRARQLIGCQVEVVKTLSGAIRVFRKGRELTCTCADLVYHAPKTVDEKTLNPEFERWLQKKEQHRPAPNHPYRHYRI